MKRFITFACLVCTLGALTMGAQALSRGRAVIADGDYYETVVSSISPGSTVYISLAEAVDRDLDYTIDRDMVPKTAKLSGVKTIAFEDDKDHKVLPSATLKIVKLPVDENIDWYFAELKVPAIKKYSEDGYQIEGGKLKVTRRDDSTFTLNFEDVVSYLRYEPADLDDALEAQPKSYKLRRNEDFRLDFSNGTGNFSGTSRTTQDVVAGMSHGKISSMTRRYPKADLTFYIGSGTSFSSINDGLLTIYSDEDYYLYEILSSGSLKNRTSSYDEDEEAFVIETKTLGSYILSDTKLSGAVSNSGSSSDDDDEDDSGTVDYGDLTDDDDDNYYSNYPLINPSTGGAR